MDLSALGLAGKVAEPPGARPMDGEALLPLPQTLFAEVRPGPDYRRPYGGPVDIIPSDKAVRPLAGILVDLASATPAVRSQLLSTEHQLVLAQWRSPDDNAALAATARGLAPGRGCLPLVDAGWRHGWTPPPYAYLRGRRPRPGTVWRNLGRGRLLCAIGGQTAGSAVASAGGHNATATFGDPENVYRLATLRRELAGAIHRLLAASSEPPSAAVAAAAALLAGGLRQAHRLLATTCEVVRPDRRGRE
jgi:hypothetical protein